MTDHRAEAQEHIDSAISEANGKGSNALVLAHALAAIAHAILADIEPDHPETP